MSLNDPIHLHALRYAAETTKVFLLERFKMRFPHYFQYARVEKRPATPRDYYVPPSLSAECVVVARTRFEEEGCRRLSCLPVRDEHWNPCTEADGPRWVAVGRRFEPACQSACRDHSVNTDWIAEEGRCVVANPYKKMAAAMTDRAFGRELPRVVRRGLDAADGTLKLNEDYCRAYGLDFADDDCVLSRTFVERLFGSKTVPAVKVAAVPSSGAGPPPTPPATPVPRMRFQPAGRTDATPGELAGRLETHAGFLKATAAELGRELGLRVTERAVGEFLAERAPELLEGAMDGPAVKLVVKHSLARSVERNAEVRFVRRFGTAASAYAVYERTAGILDALDRHAGILNKETLRDVDERLDFEYFRGGVVRPEMTPEFVWENDILTREDSEKFRFMVDRVEEYLAAVGAAPPAQKDLKAASHLNLYRDGNDWSRVAFLSIVFTAVVLAFLLLEWINVLINILFFARVYFNV